MARHRSIIAALILAFGILHGCGVSERRGQTAAGASGVLFALAAILIGSAIAWFVGRWITRRPYAVPETIKAIRSGDPLARSSITGSDEAAMGREFNSAVAEREAELRASEDGYRRLINSVRTAIVVHDGRGRILSSNPLAQELLGLSTDQLQGRALIDPEWHFLREDGSVMPVEEYPVSRVLSTRQPLHDYVAGLHRPGRDEAAWALVNAEPECDDAGDITRVIVSFVDITERKRAEAALHRLNRELRAISRCHQALLRAVDELLLLDDICRIVCEEAGYRMAWVGYPENDAARTIRPVAWAGVEDGYLEQAGITWADTERGRGPSGTAIRTGKSAWIRDFRSDPQAAPWRESALQRGYRSSISMPLKDKSAHTFGIFTIYSAEPDAFTADEIRLLEELASDLAFGIVVLRDRKELERAEERLRNSEHSLVQAQRIAHLGSWDLDVVANVLTWSDEIYRIFEIDPGEFGASYEAFLNAIHPGDREAVNKAYLDSVRNKTPYEIVHRLQMPDGRIKYVSEKGETQYDADGKLLRSIGTVHDITDRKRAEEAVRQLNAELEQRVEARTRQLQEANKELVEFSYSVSHDLRTPLRSIDGFSHALLEDYAAALDDEGKEHLRRVRAASQRMGHILDAMVRLLRLSRSGMHATRVNLSEMAAETAVELQKTEPGRDVEFAIAPGCWARGDADLLKIALESLLDNAWKYTRGKHPAKIGFGVSGAPDSPIYFVRDNGCGFDAGSSGRLFGAFQRLHTNEEFPGTGVGLASVQRIIHRHGGRVWAESQPGLGATFFFTLPEQTQET